MHELFSWAASNPMLAALLGLMLLDIAMGLVAAYGAGQLSSSVSWKGMSKKVAELLMVALSAVMSPHMPEIPILKITIGFYSITEALSILENAARIGIPLPPSLVDALSKVEKGEAERR